MNTPFNHAMEFLHLTGKNQKVNKTKIVHVQWKPPSNRYKLNTDGSSYGNPGKGGIGGVIRDKDGNWIFEYMGNIYDTTATKAEIMALLKGLDIALSTGALLHQLGNPLIQHSFREENQVADALAKEGSRMQQANCFVQWTVPPLFVLTKVEADKVGTIFV
ncbi:hypothetical protein KY289_016330 [Solanum tuberosum]|nr:hypothetical protein KY289_016330 [Solanum tuberosum]